MDNNPITRPADHKFMPATLTAIFLEDLLNVQGAARRGAVRQGKADAEGRQLGRRQHKRVNCEVDRPPHDAVNRAFDQRLPSRLTHSPA